ncbi:S-methyl-5'-thioadenosine phosphorylase [Sulfidibacter corallicola]|uniref:S-methyl-5'-thioadenosine phosphorylase n=1 Tax=Sulfidibacter corallicola TaxID=2818388 RepID=A0A8A4TXQ5_SULCO|nr:S-methyl-5'-thioadenosine phosphorylase [Sulfidibacter corallicola]QTD54001.1 S-methyl-5'-thioadenosine phosphorylase [Sulfidibacter corallicola]
MASLASIDIGIIGGSGFYQMEALTNRREIELDTPFGKPSDAFLVGELGSKTVAFLARHNRKHNIAPTELNFRANIYAFKMLGARYLISASAVGSLQQAYAPTHFVFPDQFIDRTRHRVDTFFGDGIVAHVSLADPICDYLQKVLYEAAVANKVTSHLGGTYVCMEGPQFSTRAESHMYRSFGADIIGMTNLQEAKLAREAEIPYATIAMVTDYDCWHEEEEAVTVDMVLKILKQNADAAAATIASAVENIDLAHANPIHDALQFAILTSAEHVPAERVEQLQHIVGKYLNPK